MQEACGYEDTPEQMYAFLSGLELTRDIGSYFSPRRAVSRRGRSARHCIGICACPPTIMRRCC